MLSMGASVVPARSIDSSRSFVVVPPLAEKPLTLPPAASIRWQGTSFLDMKLILGCTLI